ncbi:hypothetical protein BKA63DRAFT_571383 [Paraphoma chrysanthemicola]|nr:hypothetical protein BKA63DRAFT_571383 [Paraphoma chrysanthemicola]
MRLLNLTLAAVFSAAIAESGLKQPSSISNNTAINSSTPGDLTRPESIESQLNTAFWDDDTASDAYFERFAFKGSALMCALGGSDKTAGRLLRDTRDPPVEHWDPNKQENGKQVPIINQWYSADKTPFRTTGGHYEFGMNTQGGAMFGIFLESPKTGASSNCATRYKTITMVTVIRPENDDENDFVDASLIFHVEDAPEPPADDENGSTKVKRQDNRTVEVVHQDKNSVIRTYRFGA